MQRTHAPLFLVRGDSSQVNVIRRRTATRSLTGQFTSQSRSIVSTQMW
jgi:hypothetical protein